MSPFLAIFSTIWPTRYVVFQVLIVKFLEQLLSRIRINDYFCNCKFDLHVFNLCGVRESHAFTVNIYFDVQLTHANHFTDGQASLLMSTNDEIHDA